MPDREWRGIGDRQEVTPDRQLKAEEQLERDLDYAVKSETHLWIVTMAHRATDQLLDAQDGRTTDTPMLDTDTLLMRPAVGCYVCEQVYEPRLRRRKCPGEPKGGRRG
jgi:hypothetical protein